jgi:hypothetical protein
VFKLELKFIITVESSSYPNFKSTQGIYEATLDGTTSYTLPSVTNTGDFGYSITQDPAEDEASPDWFSYSKSSKKITLTPPVLEERETGEVRGIHAFRFSFNIETSDSYASELAPGVLNTDQFNDNFTVYVYITGDIEEASSLTEEEQADFFTMSLSSVSNDNLITLLFSSTAMFDDIGETEAEWIDFFSTNILFSVVDA